MNEPHENEEHQTKDRTEARQGEPVRGVSTVLVVSLVLAVLIAVVFYTVFI